MVGRDRKEGNEKAKVLREGSGKEMEGGPLLGTRRKGHMLA
jgi:hypothetical protein